MAYNITFALDLFNRDLDAGESLAALNTLAAALTQINLDYLRLHPNTPKIYNSGVRYANEPAGQEIWQDIPTTLRLLRGDCEDLACWRAAELQLQGTKAKAEVVVSQKYPDGRRLYHVIVRLPNGDVEDPSYNLGMRSSSSNSLVSRG